MKFRGFRLALSCALVVAFAVPAVAQNGALSITSFPSGARIIVDGDATDKVTPATLTLSRGDHRITVTAGAGSGWEPSTRTITVGRGHTEHAFTLLPIVTTGPQGIRGPKGDTGAAGPGGPQGPKGDIGLTGKQGPPGLDGTPGPEGKQGPSGPEGKQGPDGTQGPEGKQGPQGLEGKQGPQGETGATGATGAAGAVGPQGPAGAATFTAPATPPRPYQGSFFMKIGGTGDLIPLTSFAGCYDKVLNVEYEDCYVSTIFAAADIRQWFNDTVDGVNNRRDVTIQQLDLNHNELGRTTITNAFIADFAADDPDAASNDTETLSLILVPSAVTTIAGSGLPVTLSTSFPLSKRLLSQNFSLNISNVDGSKVAKISGLHMAGQKVPAAPVGARHLFETGPPVFDLLTLEIGTTGNTAANIGAWFANVAAGQSDQRSGDLQFLAANLLAVNGTLQFTSLSPVTLFPYAFGTGDSAGRRIATFTVGAFRIQ